MEQIIDGKKIAGEILINLQKEVSKLPFQPVFCDCLVGDDRVSAQYVNLKANKAKEAGMKFLRADFPKDILAEDLVLEIKKLNQTPNMCGLIVQLPLPAGLDRERVLNAIDSSIDVDALGRERNKKFYQGDLAIMPPTAAAVMLILDSLNLDLSRKNILILGQGELVGRPASFLLRQRGLSLITADKYTANPEKLMLQADVIISGAGRPKLITGDKIKKGCVVIDAGTSEDGGQIVGDADFETVKNAASYFTPVPGGVGPVTVAMLLSNVVKVAKDRSKKQVLSIEDKKDALAS